LKILVTGASGFIGSKLAAKLSENGHTVTGLIHEQDTNLSIQKHKVDLANASLSVPNEIYDVVFHLAAVTPMEKDKNKINDADLSLAHNKSQLKKLPLMILTNGELTKQAKEYINNNYLIFEKI